MTDEYNHHVLAKTASDKVLELWRNSEWSNEIVSEKVFATKSQSSFPSPDATFYDERYQRIIAFEFKPPTESKRGILTAIGQAIAYLDNANLSYIFCPKEVEGFHISQYLKKIFNENIKGKVPIGLIEYDNEDASKLNSLIEIKKESILGRKVSLKKVSKRYWAKHQDMPYQILYYILDAAYLIENVENRKHQIWKKVWIENILRPPGRLSTLDTLEEVEPHIKHHYGKEYRQCSDIKKKLREQVSNGELSTDEALKKLQQKIDPDLKGDCYSTSYKKNFLTLLNHLYLWDDDGRLSEPGYRLHKLGKLYGYNSKLFLDNLKNQFLLAGKHLDLILDMHEFSVKRNFSSIKDLRNQFTTHYDNLGKIKWNKNKREKEGQNEQFRYEFILWRNLGFISKANSKDGFIPGVGFDFDWKEITRLCSLD